MNVLTAMPEKARDDIKAALPNLRRCDVHWGRFDLAELKKRGSATPAVLIAPQGLREKQHLAGGAVILGLSMAAYVITHHSTGRARENLAAELSAGLLKLVPGNDWAMDDVGTAEDVRWHILDDPKIRSEGVALWAVTWLQPVTFFSIDLTAINAQLAGGAP